MSPVSHVLLVSHDEEWLAVALQGLTEAATRLSNPFGLAVAHASSVSEAISVVADDGHLQAVLLDKRVEGEGRWPAVELACKVGEYRPELAIYLVLEGEDELLVVEQLASHVVTGYFYRDEMDWHGWFRILTAHLADRAQTPFYDQLKAYVAMAKDAWHTPGHSGGDSLHSSEWVGDFYTFVGENSFRADLSVSVPMLDSLLHPEGVIAEAQWQAAKAFGARQTFFATNGTSTSNKVIFQTLLSPGDKVLLDRNCHKSIHHAVILSGAYPVYLNATLNQRYGICGPVLKRDVFAAITQHTDARVLVLTSCTYDGLRYDLPPIIDEAHSQGIKVVVDEAWYGFAHFHPAFRPTALEAGADYVTQSTHKVMSAFSQASMIHVNDPEFDPHLFRENFNMHASTSPQYSLIASLDIARKQMVMEGYGLLQRTLMLAEELRNKINSTAVFRVLELSDLLDESCQEDGVLLDPTKLTVDISQSGFAADELQKILFERFNIQIEKSTFNTISLLLTIGTTRSKVSRLFDALLRLSRERRPLVSMGVLPTLPEFTGLACLPRDAFYEHGERIALLNDEGGLNHDLVGRVCCDQIVPYPPGIPVAVPGQVLDEPVLVYLIRLQQCKRGMEIHGFDEKAGRQMIRVLSFAEQNRLAGRALSDISPCQKS